MKKYVVVKQKHLYTNQRNLMYSGICECEYEADVLHIQYFENNTATSVDVIASNDELKIHRVGEMHTSLCLKKGKKTNGSVLSEFGTIELEINTHKYIRKENSIAIEYDILVNEEVSDGYRIIWTIKENRS